MNDLYIPTTFDECAFIEDRMKFYTYIDFCQHCRLIKRLYKEMSYNGKLFYKWYVYANIHCNETFKNNIWNYLNNYIDEPMLKFSQKFYKAR